MKAYIEIISNNGVDFPRPLVEKWPDVSSAHIVAESFASWVLENIDTDFFLIISGMMPFGCISAAKRGINSHFAVLLMPGGMFIPLPFQQAMK